MAFEADGRLYHFLRCQWGLGLPAGDGPNGGPQQIAGYLPVSRRHHLRQRLNLTFIWPIKTVPALCTDAQCSPIFPVRPLCCLPSGVWPLCRQDTPNNHDNQNVPIPWRSSGGSCGVCRHTQCTLCDAQNYLLCKNTLHCREWASSPDEGRSHSMLSANGDLS